MRESERVAGSAGPGAGPQACTRDGCGRAVEDWDETGLCASCALEHDLFNRARRWERAAAR